MSEILNILKIGLIGLLTSLVICILIIKTRNIHGGYSNDQENGVQKFHLLPTPRIGGLGIFIGFYVTSMFARNEIKELIKLLLVAGMPAFLIGITEDITKKISVNIRLVGTMASGLIAYILTDYSITRTDVLGIDLLLKFSIISIAFTCFAVGGLSNSINIIDGFNGLASISSIYAFISFAMIGYQVGDAQIVTISLIIAMVILGFFIINWPYGKIFLGDGGSYFIGFTLSWVAIMLIERNYQVSAFSAVLVCLHPIIEVLFSIYRRKIKNKNPSKPDSMHFHSLIMKRYINKILKNKSQNSRNSVTGIIVGLLTLFAGIVSNISYTSTLQCCIIISILIIGYVLTYKRIINFNWQFLKTDFKRKK